MSPSALIILVEWMSRNIQRMIEGVLMPKNSQRIWELRSWNSIPSCFFHFEWPWFRPVRRTCSFHWLFLEYWFNGEWKIDREDDHWFLSVQTSNLFCTPESTQLLLWFCFSLPLFRKREFWLSPVSYLASARRLAPSLCLWRFHPRSGKSGIAPDEATDTE